MKNNIIEPVIFFTLIFTICGGFSCEYTQTKNILEIELNKIEEGTKLDSLKVAKFQGFRIDWENPSKWESSCETFYVIPFLDTFENNYHLDFCYDKYRWWETAKKCN